MCWKKKAADYCGRHAANVLLGGEMLTSRKPGAVAEALALITNDYDLDGEHEYEYKTAGLPYRAGDL